MQPKKSLSDLQKKVLSALADGGVLYVVTEYLRKTKVMMCRRGVDYFPVNKNTFNSLYREGLLYQKKYESEQSVYKLSNKGKKVAGNIAD